VLVLTHDILICFKERDKQITYSGVVLQAMGEHQLYDNLKKCEFWLEQVVFLDYPFPKDGRIVNLESENNFK